MTLDHQSKEEGAINGDNTEYGYKSKGWRHPLVLYVDGVVSLNQLQSLVHRVIY